MMMDIAEINSYFASIDLIVGLGLSLGGGLGGVIDYYLCCYWGWGLGSWWNCK